MEQVFLALTRLLGEDLLVGIELGVEGGSEDLNASGVGLSLALEPQLYETQRRSSASIHISQKHSQAYSQLLEEKLKGESAGEGIEVADFNRGSLLEDRELLDVVLLAVDGEEAFPTGLEGEVAPDGARLVEDEGRGDGAVDQVGDGPEGWKYETLANVWRETRQG